MNPPNDALSELHRQRQAARRRGAVVVAAGLLVGALFAPKTALLVFVFLVVFGTLGIGVSFVLRLFSRWFDRPKQP